MKNIFKKLVTAPLNKIGLIINDLGPVKKARHRRQLRLFGYGLLWAISLYIIFLIVILLFFINNISVVINESLSGKAFITQAVASARAENYTEASQLGEVAHKHFANGQLAIASMHDSKLISSLPVLNSEVDELYNLLSAVEILSRGFEQGTLFAANLKSAMDPSHHLSYSKFTPEEKGRIIDKIYTSGPELNGLRADFDLALTYLEKLKFHGILLPFKSQLSQVRSIVATGAETLKIAVPMSEVLPLVAGHPNNSTFLLLLQNADELRPTGGFLGTYGILETSQGDIVRLETHDVYHMDMPVKDQLNIEPPAPIRDYLNKKWYMRDSNWSPDWPTSARQISDFYTRENAMLTGKDQINNFDGQFTGVMAVSPGLVVRLLRLVGPIQVGNDTYTADNFSRLLEYKVEQGYIQDGVPAWQRKEVIGEIVKELKIKLFDLSLSRWPELVSTIDQALAQRDLLFYMNNSIAEKTMLEQNWAGEIRAVSSDYLNWVDANLASLKTDAVVSRDFDYNYNQATGRAKLVVTYHHTQLRLDWRTSAYKTYARLYTPLGSKLIAFNGARTEPVTSVENGKTVFGALINVVPGETKTVTVEYELPTTVQVGNYALYVQKQPNLRVGKLLIDVNLKDEVKSFSPQGASAAQDKNEVFWQTSLTADRYFQVNK